MARVNVRVGAGRLDPARAERYQWDCARHHAAGVPICVNECCGQCYYLQDGVGCELGSFKPVRCKMYPIVPQRNRVIVDRRCPDAARFVENVQNGDPAALALLEVAKSMSDLLAKGGDDQSAELDWLMGYTKDGFSGPTVWKRGKLHGSKASERIAEDDGPPPPPRVPPKRRGRDARDGSRD